MARREQTRRYLRRARVLVAANLGAGLGYLIWLNMRCLTRAEGTARSDLVVRLLRVALTS